MNFDKQFIQANYVWIIIGRIFFLFFLLKYEMIL